MGTELKERAIVSRAAVECLVETGYDTSQGTSLDFVEQLGPAAMASLLQPLEQHGLECNAHGHVGVAVMHVDGSLARLWLFRLQRPRLIKPPEQQLSSLLFRGIDLRALMLAQKLADVTMDEGGVIQEEVDASLALGSESGPRSDDASPSQQEVVVASEGEESLPVPTTSPNESGRWI